MGYSQFDLHPPCINYSTKNTKKTQRTTKQYFSLCFSVPPLCILLFQNLCGITFTIPQRTQRRQGAFHFFALKFNFSICTDPTYEINPFYL